jgi:hypothetical protein
MKHYTSTLELQKPYKILGIWKRRYNAFCEINNLFATRELADITPDDIAEISCRYKFDAPKKYQSKFCETILQPFNRAIVADNKLSDEDAAALNKIGALLQIPDETLCENNKQIVADIVQKAFTKICLDRRISPEERTEFENLCSNLRIDFDTLGYLSRFSKYWELENLTLPEVEADINLSKNEKCYFHRDSVEWYEYRSRRTRIDYGGITGRVKICKGVGFRWGSIAPSYASTRELSLVKTGSLYLTNKNLIFIGDYQNSTIPIAKILSFEPYSDGVAINKSSGKSPLLMLPDAEEFSVILERLINEN